MNGMLTWELKICMPREILFETDDGCELKALVLRGDTNETFCQYSFDVLRYKKTRGPWTAMPALINAEDS